MDPVLHPRLLGWWKDDPADPDRPSLTHPDVQRLLTEISPGARAIDLGGVMSLNARLDPEGLVLRVHQPFVTRQRILAVQRVRQRLADLGLVVPAARRWRDRQVFRCGNRWAELEGYLPHERAPQTPDSYRWLFGALGSLHYALATIERAVPRPLVATYAPPGSLRRWLPVTEAAVRDDPAGVDISRLLHELVRQLRARWVPAARLPMHLVHGDVRLSNICRTPEGTPLYLDFGFLAYRPRVHDLAYALAFMVRALNGHQAPDRFAWHIIPRIVEVYEATAGAHLVAAEKRALAPYTAAVPLYAAALDGFSNDPVGLLRDRLPFLRLSEWLLAHPDALLG